MIMIAHSDAGFNNDTKSRIIAAAHIFLSENEPIPRWNGPLLPIAQIIKYVMSLVVEAKMVAFFSTEK